MLNQEALQALRISGFNKLLLLNLPQENKAKCVMLWLSFLSKVRPETNNMGK